MNAEFALLQRGMQVAPLASLMSGQRSAWIRGLRLYDSGRDVAMTRLHVSVDGDIGDERVHARSLFRSFGDPNRFALYSLHDIDSPRPGQRRGHWPGTRPGITR